MTAASPLLRMVAGHPFCITTVVPPGVTLDEPAAAGS
jgi:hypothetical protein